MIHEYTARDTANALADYIQIRAGRVPVDADPVAIELSRRTPLGELLARIAGTTYSRDTLKRVLTSSDVGDALGKALTRIAGIAYDQQRNELAPVIADVPARGVRPVELPLLDLGEVSQATANAEIALATIASATVAAPALFAGRFLVNRELLLADGVGIIDATTRQLAGQPARIEARLAAEALDAASITTTTNVGMDVSAIGEALATLRTRTTSSDNTANLRGEYLLVHPDNEAAALILNDSMGGRLTIISNPWLSGASYLLCPPSQATVLARPVFDDGRPMVMPTTPGTRNPETGLADFYDGAAYLLEAYVGVSVVDVTGVVEIPAS